MSEPGDPRRVQQMGAAGESIAWSRAGSPRAAASHTGGGTAVLSRLRIFA